MSDADELVSPWGFRARSQSPLHPVFRRLDAAADPPPGLPFGFTLGPPLAPGNDWTMFAEEANARGPVGADHRVFIAYTPATERDAADFVSSLDAQVFAGRIVLSLHGPAAKPPARREGTRVLLHSLPFWRRSMRETARQGANSADTIVLLSGRCMFDPLALERICRMTRLNRLLVVPLAEASARPERAVSVPATIADWPDVEPHRAVRGLNLALPSALARVVGPLARDAAGDAQTGRDYAIRCHEAGAYFAPVFVPVLTDHGAKPVTVDSTAGNGVPAMPGAVAREEPRVSIIVNARQNAGAAKLAAAQLASWIEPDCEICVWEGKAQPLLKTLRRRLKGTDGTRVVVAADLDGAVAATRGRFIWLLEAADGLTPEIMREVMRRFDTEPHIVAARLQGVRAGQEQSWRRTTGDMLLLKPETGTAMAFRRRAWERTRTAGAGTRGAADLLLDLAAIGTVDTLRVHTKGAGQRSRREAQQAGGVETERIARALARRTLDRHWAPVAGADPEAQKVALKEDGRLVVFWPDFSKGNPYQRLLYGTGDAGVEYVSGTIEAAIRAAQDLGGSRIIFHMHWANRIFLPGGDPAEVRAKAHEFLARVGEFKQLGGMVAWTIHNVITHNSEHRAAELEFSNALVALADRVHLHSRRSLQEVEAHFPIPAEKVRIAPHGSYAEVYADYVPQSLARAELGLAEGDDVLLFTGRLRPYKGLADLVAAFRRLLPAHPGLRLILAGEAKGDEGREAVEGLTDAERSRVLVVDRFLDNDEMQLFLRAADAGVYPYDEVLTSGSVLLALTFGLPCIAPRFGMLSEVIEGEGEAAGGILYDRHDPAGLEGAISEMLAGKRAGKNGSLSRAALAAAERNAWVPFAGTIFDQ
jgi:glycosyltransferase involved in cell wall biosynthesis